MELPVSKVKSTRVNPKTLLMFSYPKTGKTEALTQLDDCLIVDFEKGTEFYDALKVNVDTQSDLADLFRALKENEKHYKYIALDTITSLYDGIANEMAISLYNKENNKNLSPSYNITSLQYGVGYTYIRDAIQRILKKFEEYCDTLIICGHAADKALTGDDGLMNVKDVDIPGKLKNIISLKVDALGLLYRKETGKNFLSFIHSSELIGGTRAKHLSNKEFLLSEMTEEGLKTHWEDIFI